jgi:hypothetical protein
MIKKLITIREIRVFAISGLTSFTLFALGNTASAYWADTSITLPATSAITSAAYVPPPTFGPCTVPPAVNKGQGNFQVMINPPTGYDFRRNALGNQPVPSLGSPGVDAYQINLTLNNDNPQLPTQGTGSGSPAATAVAPLTFANGVGWQGADSTFANYPYDSNPHPGLIWGFAPLSQSFVSSIVGGSSTGTGSGQVSVAAQIGSWVSTPAVLNYSIQLQTTFKGILGIGTTSVDWISASCGPVATASLLQIATQSLLELPAAVQSSSAPDESTETDEVPEPNAAVEAPLDEVASS